MKISYECEELIEELKEDIEEFGEDTEVVVFFKKINGITIITNYDFIEDEEPIEPTELEKDEETGIMKMSDLLKYLEKQNEIL